MFPVNKSSYTIFQAFKRILARPVVFVTLILLVHASLGLHTMSRLSQTHDEASTLFTGYAYLKSGDLKGAVLPVFTSVWAALPLLYLNPNLPSRLPSWDDPGYRFFNRFYYADEFLYKNKVDAELMLNSARAMTIVLSLLLGFALYSWAKEKYGVYPGFIALVLWCFSSNFIAFGSLITSDMPVTLFYFLSVYFFWRWAAKRGGGDANIALSGVSMGLAFVSKHTSAIILPVMVLVYLWALYIGKNKLSIQAKRAALWIACAVIAAIAVYRIVDAPYLWDGLKLTFNNLAVQKKDVFLLGKLSSDGWFYYFPAAFLLKTPIPFLILLIASMRIKRTDLAEKVPFILLPALLYVFASCFASSNVQIGVRYILPALPFLILWVAGSFSGIRSKAGKVIGVALILWYVAEGVSAHPWHISYFNQLIGPRQNAYKYLTDSNLDWGQGVKELGKYVKQRGVQTIFFSQFGHADPHYYGINYVPYACANDLHYTPYVENRRLGYDTKFYLKKGQPVLYAVSGLLKSYWIDQEWLKDIPHETVIARSIFIYDLSKHPEYLGAIPEVAQSDRGGYYFRKGQEAQQKGETDRAIAFYLRHLKSDDPGHSHSLYNLGRLYMEKKQYRKAADYFRQTLNTKPDYYEANIRLSECLNIAYPGREYDIFVLGFSYQKVGDLDNAIGCYLECLKMDPSSSQIWFNLGYAYMDKKQYRRAVDCFNIALKLKPDYDEAREHILYCARQLSAGPRS